MAKVLAGTEAWTVRGMLAVVLPVSLAWIEWQDSKCSSVCPVYTRMPAQLLQRHHVEWECLDPPFGAEK